MRDIFDEFLEELRRREAIARGEDPDADAPRRAKAVGPNPDDDGPSQPRRPARRGRRDGRSRRWWAIVLVGVAAIVLLTFGLDLWTDALWFQSVRYEPVFWTRVGAQVGLFLAAATGALAVVVTNLAIAARFTQDIGDGRSPLRDVFERLNDAADPRRGRGRAGDGGPRTVTFGSDDIPDLTPVARVALIGIVIFVALTIGASIASSWTTILLWANRVPFSPDPATPVVDPVFGRDIGFFLFEL